MSDTPRTPPIPPLAELEFKIAADLEILEYPAADWVEPRISPDGSKALDCAIVGAGQFGLTIAAGLRRERVDNLALFDAAPAGLEGPWLTFARMAMLRTPKTLTGPDLGIPSLSFRAWWEAQHGRDGWEAMFRIPRQAWMDYLVWLRRTLDLPVRNGWRLCALDSAANGELLKLQFATPDGSQTLYARTCVLATGAIGSGGYLIPDEIRAAVPAARLHHANDPFDPAILRGMRIGVLGAGAAAFDVATAALRAGASSADLCFRRPALPRSNPRRWMENAGYLGHYVDLPDTQKWATMNLLYTIGQGPPQPTYDAALACPGFAIHPATPWEDVRWSDGEILVRSGDRSFRFDAVVVATGMRVDFELRPELSSLRQAAAFWSDRYAPRPGEESATLAKFPYLDRFGAFTPREEADAEAKWVERVLTITRGATLSLGPVAASNSGMKYVAPRLIEGVKRRLFLDQAQTTWAQLNDRDHTEVKT